MERDVKPEAAMFDVSTPPSNRTRARDEDPGSNGSGEAARRLGSRPRTEMPPMAIGTSDVVTRAEFTQLQANVKEYVLNMRGEILEAVKRQDQRIDGLYGLNLKDMRTRIETLEATAGTAAPPGPDVARVGALEAELLGFQTKLNAYDHELQGVILETRGAVERLALFEASFQQTSKKSFVDIKTEFGAVEHAVKGLMKTVGTDKRAELNLDAPNTVFDKVNWVYSKVEELNAKFVDEKCHCKHVEKLLDELERHKAMARAGGLGAPGGANSSSDLGGGKSFMEQLFPEGECPHCRHVDELHDRVKRIEDDIANG